MVDNAGAAFRNYRDGIDGLIRDLDRLRHDVSSTDVTLRVGPDREPIRAHSTVLAARSPVLRDKILQYVTRSGHEPPVARLAPNTEIALPTTSQDIMNDVLRYMYTGQISIRGRAVFDIMVLANELEMASLSQIAVQHMKRTARPSQLIEYLALALEKQLSTAVVYLARSVAKHTELALSQPSFLCAADDVVKYIVKQEDLSASEDIVWKALLRRAFHKAGVPLDLAADQLSEQELRDVGAFLRDFARPGMARFLNLDVLTFAQEVEPFEIVSDEELLLKYRFEATANTATFEHAFPYEQIEFLTRIRMRTLFFESDSHPHRCGVREKTAVVLPSWTKRAEILFDPKCQLGRYSDLSFYEDDKCAVKLTSLAAIQADHRVKCRSDPSLKSKEPALELTCQRFWFVFYTPVSFPPAWGYSFRVVPMTV